MPTGRVHPRGSFANYLLTLPTGEWASEPAVGGGGGDGWVERVNEAPNAFMSEIVWQFLWQLSQFISISPPSSGVSFNAYFVPFLNYSAFVIFLYLCFPCLCLMPSLTRLTRWLARGPDPWNRPKIWSKCARTPLSRWFIISRLIAFPNTPCPAHTHTHTS